MTAGLFRRLFLWIPKATVDGVQSAAFYDLIDKDIRLLCFNLGSAESTMMLEDNILKSGGQIGSHRLSKRIPGYENLSAILGIRLGTDAVVKNIPILGGITIVSDGGRAIAFQAVVGVLR